MEPSSRAQRRQPGLPCSSADGVAQQSGFSPRPDGTLDSSAPRVGVGKRDLLCILSHALLGIAIY